MGTIQHQHPPTYVSTGIPEKDFKYSNETCDADISRYLPTDKSAAILDVGCGWGQCLWWLKSKGYENIVGIDVGVDQESHGQSLGLNVIRVDDSKAFLENHKSEFDVILMNHVIEHVPADEGLRILKAILNSLKRGGRLVVQTPNMNSIGANAGRYIEISHVTGYSETSLHQIMDLAGFKNIEVFGSKTTITLRPRRLAWASLQIIARLIWKIMLISELGSDSPAVIEKNLYATGLKQDS
jgi:2-polyprenyl-3-methyl-5-hydroxy-6-metoxy-1,4-benzoquinol methylase